MTAGNSGMPSVGEICRRRIRGMDFDEWLRHMRAEPGARARTRHGVPLVAHPSGIEAERELLAVGGLGGQQLGCDETRLAVRGIELAGREEPPVFPSVPVLAFAQWPLQWIESIELAVADVRQTAEIEGAPAAVLEGGECRMLAKDLRR